MHYSPPVDPLLEQRTFEPGARIGDVWEVLRPLGKGGMGSVYACRNKDAPAIRVAVKVLTGFAAFHPVARKRFLREAEILSAFDHPNLVRVTNLDLDARPPFLVMELVEGRQLTIDLMNGPLHLEVALRRFAQLVDAIAYLHRRRVFHRDIKPENVMVQTDGSVKLVDFGLAKESGFDITLQGRVEFGTVEYCPPEWVDAEALEPAAWDCYALGVLFYEMLTGRMAFTVPPDLTDAETAMWVMATKQDLPHLDPGDRIPEPIRALVRDLTRYSASERLTDCTSLSRRLREVT